MDRREGTEPTRARRQAAGEKPNLNRGLGCHGAHGALRIPILLLVARLRHCPEAGWRPGDPLRRIGCGRPMLQCGSEAQNRALS